VAAAVAEGLDWATLGDRAESPVGTLSGGQRRRANLAAGALHRPDVLLLDEPTVGVDPAARERLHAMLRDLRARGTAILLATHDLDQATELGRPYRHPRRRPRRRGGHARAAGRRRLAGRRELSVRLAQEPDATATAALAAEGLRARREAREWSGSVDADLAQLPELGRRLAAAGVPVAEVRLREPGCAASSFASPAGNRRVSGVVFRAMALGFARDRAALAMSLALPVVVFLVFAAIFSGASGEQLRVKVALADEVRSDETGRLARALARDPAVELVGRDLAPDAVASAYARESPTSA